MLSGSKELKKMEKYELVKDLGAGNFGVARLLRHKETRELVAMKYIERGHKVCCHFKPFFFFFFGLAPGKITFRKEFSFMSCGCFLKIFLHIPLFCHRAIREIESFVLFLVLIILQIDENVAREIINHRSLRHNNIIRFKEVSFYLLKNLFEVIWIFNEAVILFDDGIWIWLQVVLTPTHLAIVMEYAAGGELFDRICTAGRFSEAEVNYHSLFISFVLIAII